MLDLDRQNQWRERYRTTHPDWQPATEVYFANVVAALRPGTRILDLGCGRGGLVEQLPGPPPGFVGLDPDIQSLLEHRIATLPRVAARSDALPFPGGAFDVVVASWLLEHLDRPQDTLREVARVLVPGGRFIFITPNGRHPLTAANRLFGRAGRLQGALVNRLYGRVAADTFPTAYRANSPKAIAALAAATGLQVIALRAIADPTYLAFSPGMFRLMAQVEDRLPVDRHIHLVGVLGK